MAIGWGNKGSEKFTKPQQKPEEVTFVAKIYFPGTGVLLKEYSGVVDSDHEDGELILTFADDSTIEILGNFLAILE